MTFYIESRAMRLHRMPFSYPAHSPEFRLFLLPLLEIHSAFYSGWIEEHVSKSDSSGHDISRVEAQRKFRVFRSPAT
jgi:hypothetical protein